MGKKKEHKPERELTLQEKRARHIARYAHNINQKDNIDMKYVRGLERITKQ